MKSDRFKIIYILGAVIIAIFIIIAIAAYQRPNITDDVDELIFSKESGFYDDDFELSISAPHGTVYYTLDGSEPTRNSIRYDGPIHITDASKNPNVYSMRTDVSTGFLKDLIAQYSTSDPEYRVPDYNVDKCTVVRAVIYLGGESYSDVKTASYFVGFQEKPGYENMNFLSIVTDPENLFGYEDGIYVTGKTFDELLPHLDEYDRKKDWWWWLSNYSRDISVEKPASLQFFDSDGNLVLSQNGGIDIHGGGSRGSNPKSFNLYTRKQYDGYKHFREQLFSEAYYPKKMTLTQGGDDDHSKLMDYITNTLVDDPLVATMEFRPYVMFLDGEYWGVYWLTEKYDKRYISYHYGVDEDNVIMIKDWALKEGDEAAGDKGHFDQMMEFCSSADMTDPANYQRACDLIDIDSMINYYSYLIYSARSHDWPVNNVAMWRVKRTGEGRYNDGRWRYMIFDMNSSAMREELIEHDTIAEACTLDMFRNMFLNPDFRNRLLDRLSTLGTTTFEPSHVQQEIDRFKALMDVPIEYNHKRFFGEGSKHYYTDKVKSIERFYQERPAYVQKLIESYR